MAFNIRNLMIGLLLFSLVFVGFSVVVQDLNNNYGQSHMINNTQSEAYLNKTTAITNSLQTDLSSTNLAQAGLIGSIATSVLGGVAVAQMFFTLITTIPFLMGDSITYFLNSIGLGLFAPIVQAIALIMIIFALVKFIFGRDP